MREFFIKGPHVLYWFPHPKLRIIAAWGSPDREDLELVRSGLTREFTLPKHDGIIDIRRIDAAVSLVSLLESLFSFMHTNREVWNKTIERGAVVHSSSAMAAALIGYRTILKLESTARNDFASLGEAFAWLGHGGEALSLRAEQTIRDAIGGDAVVALSQVRQWIANNLSEPTVAQCARALCVSERSLQRMLQESSTSLRDELAKARVDRAKEILRTTDAKLESVAKDVGLSKSQSLNTLFKRLTGSSPTEWREGQRATRSD